MRCDAMEGMNWDSIKEWLDPEKSMKWFNPGEEEVESRECVLFVSIFLEISCTTRLSFLFLFFLLSFFLSFCFFFSSVQTTSLSHVLSHAGGACVLLDINQFSTLQSVFRVYIVQMDLRELSNRLRTQPNLIPSGIYSEYNGNDITLWNKGDLT